MPLVPDDYERRVRAAVAHYWKTLQSQQAMQKPGNADRGGRAAVTGGRQMDLFCSLVNWLLVHNRMPEANIYVRDKLTLPGFFRPTKDWDMVVVHRGHLVAAIEFKSQKGPSFGNNFNNRTEEALGNAKDIWTAYREGAFGVDRPRPWLGWVMLLEDCSASTRPVGVKEPHFNVFPEFKQASCAKRYELLLRKLVLEQLYDGTALLMSTETEGPRGIYTEPASDLKMKKFLAALAALAGHARAYLESV